MGGSRLDQTDDFLKICRTGLDANILDQDWTRTEKFLSRLISVMHDCSLVYATYRMLFVQV